MTLNLATSLGLLSILTTATIMGGCSVGSEGYGTQAGAQDAQGGATRVEKVANAIQCTDGICNANFDAQPFACGQGMMEGVQVTFTGKLEVKGDSKVTRAEALKALSATTVGIPSLVKEVKIPLQLENVEEDALEGYDQVVQYLFQVQGLDARYVHTVSADGVAPMLGSVTLQNSRKDFQVENVKVTYVCQPMVCPSGLVPRPVVGIRDLNRGGSANVAAEAFTVVCENTNPQRNDLQTSIVDNYSVFDITTVCLQGWRSFVQPSVSVFDLSDPLIGSVTFKTATVGERGNGPELKLNAYESYGNSGFEDGQVTQVAEGFIATDIKQLKFYWTAPDNKNGQIQVTEGCVAGDAILGMSKQ